MLSRLSKPFLLMSIPLVAVVGLGSARAQPACDNPLAAEAQAVASLSLKGSERDALHKFYVTRAEGAQPAPCVWSDEAIGALRGTLSRAGDQGLNPMRYHATALDGPAMPARDLSATAMALRYAHDMVMGQVDQALLSDDVDVPRPTLDLDAALGAALGAKHIGPWLAELQPTDPQYAALLKALAVYREKADQTEPPPLPDGLRLTVGWTDRRVVFLKNRLRASGDYKNPDSSRSFDAETRAAVMSFQRRHGMAPDGRVRYDTRDELNVPAVDRLRQIMANLERRRYFGHVTPATRIEVNTAAATATLYRNGHAVLAMRAVVGDPEHPSPMLISSGVTAVVVNPSWVIPSSIIQHEILPKAEQDPTYIERKNMHWSGSQLVQAPGPQNALGRLKLDFPNPFSVYLHDTPAHSLFASYDRAESHGCIRLQHPIDMALAVLSKNDVWSRARLEEAIAQGTTKRIAVADGPAVVLAYWTVFADDDGTMEFRDDIYGRDDDLLAEIPDLGMTRRLTDASGSDGCCKTARN